MIEGGKISLNMNNYFNTPVVKISTGASFEEWIKDPNLRLMDYLSLSPEEGFSTGDIKGATIGIASVIKKRFPRFELALDLQIEGNSRRKRIPLVVVNKDKKFLHILKIISSIREVDAVVKVLNDLEERLLSSKCFPQLYYVNKISIVLNEENMNKYKEYLQSEEVKNKIRILSLAEFIENLDSTDYI